jgi:hypothetical protein
MFRIGSAAKIVIMVEMSSLLSARGGAFVDVALRLRALFQEDFRMIVGSCLLVITKQIDAVMTKQEIIGTIEEISQDNKNLKVEGVMLLKSLIS